MKKIILHGWMAKKFGKEFNLEVRSAAEAVRALCMQLPGFRAAMETSRATHNCGFAIFYGMDNIEEGALTMITDAKTIRIVPRVLGAKNGGWTQVIMGVVVIAISLIADYASSGTFGASTQYATYSMGVAMILGGVVQLLTPVPKKKSAEDRPENQPSYTFNGPINTQAQGRRVSVLYGRNIVGSAVISAGITARDYGTVYNNPTTGGGGGGHVGAPSRRDWIY